MSVCPESTLPHSYLSTMFSPNARVENDYKFFNSPAQLSVHLSLGLSVLQVQRWLLAVGKLYCCHLLRYGPHLLS